MDIEVRGERADAIPAKVVAIAMIFRIAGDGIDREQAERAIEHPRWELVWSRLCWRTFPLSPDRYR
jgi:hypothetical protein